MSNHLAIATVTATLRDALDKAIQDDTSLSGGRVLMERPRHPPPEHPGVFLHLYQVTPNAALRSHDLPTRRTDGTALGRAEAALDLHYLIVCFGDEKTLVPQRLLGIVVRTLHARPLVTPGMIRNARTNHAFLSTSDLADSPERVRVTPVTPSLEDLSKIWSVFLSTPQMLSVAYQASVVLLEDAAEPMPALPVREAGIFGTTLRLPELESAAPVDGPGLPVLSGTTLRLRGSALAGPLTRVRLGAAEAVPSFVTDREVAFTVAEPPFPPGSLRAGLLGVQVVHRQEIGPDRRQLAIAESNPVGVLLRPAFLEAPALDPIPRSLRVRVHPPVAPGQRVSLSLFPGGGGSATTVAVEPPTSATSVVTVSLQGVPAGRYIVRFRVDGADTLLVADESPTSPTFGQFVGPAVDLP